MHLSVYRLQILDVMVEKEVAAVQSREHAASQWLPATLLRVFTASGSFVVPQSSHQSCAISISDSSQTLSRSFEDI